MSIVIAIKDKNKVRMWSDSYGFHFDSLIINRNISKINKISETITMWSAWLTMLCRLADEMAEIFFNEPENLLLTRQTFLKYIHKISKFFLDHGFHKNNDGCFDCSLIITDWKSIFTYWWGNIVDNKESFATIGGHQKHNYWVIAALRHIWLIWKELLSKSLDVVYESDSAVWWPKKIIKIDAKK
jgi:hypothetical protein